MSQPERTTEGRCRTRVVVVGAGPIGLELAVALRRRGMDFVILDRGPIGHTISWWAPQTRWFSSNERIAIAGVPLLTPDQSKATREQYLTYLRAVAAQFDIHVRCFEPVIGVDRHPSGTFTVHTQPGERRREIDCESVVLAIGGTDHPRRLGVEGEELPHVDGYLREPHRYCGRKVLIIGGRNSAVEAALRLHHVGAQVSLCYRGTELPADGIKYWLLPEIRSLISTGRIAGYLGTCVRRITPTHVVLQRVASGETESFEVEADEVLSLVGYEQDKSLFQTCGIELLDIPQRPSVDPETLQSNVPGIYVAGTAVAGTQSSHYKTFLENCHDHVDRIVAHLAGVATHAPSQPYARQMEALPES